MHNVIAVSVLYRQTITRTIERYLSTGNATDRERSRRPRLLGREHYVAIDNAMDKNSEIITLWLKELLLEKFLGLSASERIIARVRSELGWVHQKARYCQKVQDANKGIWLEWAKRMTKKEEQFDNVLFTDESTFQVDYHSRRAYRRV